MRVRARLLLASIVVATLIGSDARAEKRVVLSDVPCAGCKASSPVGSEPTPLLVVLHGDWGQGPAGLLSAWERHAALRGVALLAPQCPADLGCKGSWWQWNGDPSWVTAQVDAFAQKRAIDRERTWIAGWSGGASYMGLRATELQRSFAALVYHGGGIPPRAPCPSADAKRAPVYFLVGTANPLHHLAVSLRDHHRQCGDSTVWNALAGAEHTAEWRMLETRGGDVLDWLLRLRRR
jgi:poly(3-hydroxybutyrate) depolymerase